MANKPSVSPAQALDESLLMAALVKISLMPLHDVAGNTYYSLSERMKRTAIEAIQRYQEQARLRAPSRATPVGAKCSCWLGRPGATFGNSDERVACAVHGESAPSRATPEEEP